MLTFQIYNVTANNPHQYQNTASALSTSSLATQKGATQVFSNPEVKQIPDKQTSKVRGMKVSQFKSF
jgi:hypothetical protein